MNRAGKEASRILLKLKSLLGGFLLFTITAFICVFILEGVVRLLFPVYDPAGLLEFRQTADGVRLGIKNFTGRLWKNTGEFDVIVHFNAYGFRDPKDLRGTGPKSLFVAGDSFSFGYGVKESERYSDLLESMLDIPVFNISIPASNLRDYEKIVHYAEQKGAVIKNLIVGVTMEGDLLDYESGISRSYAPLREPSRFFQRFQKWLIKNSALYHWVASRIYRSPLLETMAIKAGLIIPNYDRVRPNRLDERVLSSSARILSRLAASTNTLVMLIPSRALWVGGHKSEESEIHRQFLMRLKALGVNVLDLRPLFEEGRDPLQYHFKKDGHWNRKGHLLAARSIAEAIQNGRYPLIE